MKAVLIVILLFSLPAEAYRVSTEQCLRPHHSRVDQCIGRENGKGRGQGLTAPTVPIPGAVWLLVSGLGVLWVGRKK